MKAMSSPLMGLWRSNPAFRIGAILGAVAGVMPMLYLGVVRGTRAGSWGESLLGAAIGIPIGILMSLLVFAIGGTLAAGAASGLLSASLLRAIRMLWRAAASK